MSFRIIYGKSGTGKSEYIFEEVKKYINGDNKIYIITPEQFSFSAEKRLVEKINSGAVVNAEIITFNSLAHKVMNEVGKEKKDLLTISAKSMLIYDLLTKQKKSLNFLGKSDQNIDLILKQITEFKKNIITPDDLENAMKTINNDYLKLKMNDILNLYKGYENSIKNKFIDENDILTILNEKLDETKIFNDALVYMDEFNSFTKQEYNIIEKIMKKAKILNITICSNSIDFIDCPVSDLFYENKHTANNLLLIAEKENVSIEDHVNLKIMSKYKNKELEHIEKNLYAIPYIKEESDQNIEIFLANNQYSEIEHLACKIINIVKNDKTRYRDISVITKNLDTYANLIKVIFEKYNIPFYIDNKKDLSQNMLVRYIFSILDIFSNNWSFESVFNYIKTGFVEINKAELFEFENYCLKWGIKNEKWYEGDWDFGDIKQSNINKINTIKDIRNRIVLPLVELKNNINNNDNIENITMKIYEFLLKNNITSKIEQKSNQLLNIGEEELASEYINSWKILIDVFDEMVLIFGKEKLNFEKYMNILRIGLDKSDLSKPFETHDKVIVGDIDISRSNKIENVFIIGLNDGMFPSVNKTEGFFNDSDRECLKNSGIEFTKGTIERLYEDNFSNYKAFTVAEKRLYLSYSSSDSEGKSLRPSSLITKTKKLFPNIKEQSDIIIKQSEILSEKNAFEELLNQIRDLNDGKIIEKKWYIVYKLFKENPEWSIELNNALEAIKYKNTSENIIKENIEKLYGNSLSTSVSRLEQYRLCPFSYFLKYQLKISDKDGFRIKAVDTGTFMHDIIDQFFEYIEKNLIEIRNIKETEINNIVDNIVNENLKNDKYYIFLSTAKYEFLTQRLKKVIIKSLKYIIESIEFSDFEILGNEIEFKNGKKYEPIKFNLDNGIDIEITGKIDRVDIAKFKGEKYVRIIDYKSSIKDIDLNEVYEGLQLQLLTYLDAICKKEELLPGGVLYFSLVDNIIKSNGKLSEDDINEKIREQYKMKGLIIDEPDIVKLMDKNLEIYGKSKIIPAGLVKDGSIKKTKSVISKEEFEYLKNYMTKIIKQIASEILDGNIEIKPNKKKKISPCGFCEYKSICNINIL